MSQARSLGRALVAALLLSTVLAHTASAAPADVVNTWSTRASQLAAAAGMPPLRNPITLALVHLAIYDAVNAIERGYSPYASRPHVTPGASPEAAVVEAAYRILLVELPTQLPALGAARTADLTLIPEPGRSQGLAVGAAAAAALLAQRTGDGRNAVVPYTPGSGPGVWIPTPPGFLPAAAPFLARVVPFTMRRASQFRPDGPPRLRSRQYAEDYREVMALGAKVSAARTPEQTAHRPLLGAARGHRVAGVHPPDRRGA